MHKVEEEKLRAVEKAARRLVKFSGPWPLELGHGELTRNFREAERAQRDLAARLADLDDYRKAHR